MSWLFLVPCVAAAGFAALRMDGIEVEGGIPSSVDVSCLGCNGSSSSWSSLECVSIDVDSNGFNEDDEGSFALEHGRCLANGSHCSASPCRWTWDVEITIVNNCSQPVYYRSRLNGDCVPGTLPIAGGAAFGPQTYEKGNPIECGKAWQHLVFLSDPAPGCAPGNAVAGWSFTCSSCQGVSTP